MRTAIPTPKCIDVNKDYIYVDITLIGCGEHVELKDIVYKDVDLFHVNLMTFEEIAEAKHRAKYQFLLDS